MDHAINLGLTAGGLATALGLELMGDDLPILGVTPFSSAEDYALCFNKRSIESSLGVKAVVVASNAANRGCGSVLVSANPRLDFARALAWIDSKGGFVRDKSAPVVDPTAVIGMGTVLGRGVRIGAGTIVGSNVVIGDGVIIGANCVIKSCAVIGEDGFGFERDELGLPVRLVHLGTVRIGNHVEVGSLTTVCRGTLADTVIEDYVKIDDHVHIAHNVQVRKAAMVIACAEVSGGVVIGEGAWVGPNASVIQQVKIGSGALVGIGSNVVRSVDDGVTVAGNPAKPMVKRGE